MSQIGVANPWVRFDPITETVRCDRCLKTEYIRDRAAEIVLDAIERFLKVHRTCHSSSELLDQRKDLR